MKQVVVKKFGGPDVLQVVDRPMVQPGPTQVRVQATSIGMNHADLMGRRGEYQLMTGQPPFTPGLEAGGVIDAIGQAVTDREVGQRVILCLDVPQRNSGASSGGTYRSHYICAAHETIVAPDAVPDNQLGAIWLPYLTAWGCLVHRQNVQPGQIVAMPAASSSVAMAAAQIVKKIGGMTIGLTSSPDKIATLKQMSECVFDHLLLTQESTGRATAWRNNLKKMTDGHGVNVFFDPVAAGAYLETEIRLLAQGGVIWIYGLLGKPDIVNVTPLIRKGGAIRGWAVHALAASKPEVLEAGYRFILDGFASGTFRQSTSRVFPLDDVQKAHAYMERGQHIGKLVLIP